MYGSQLPVKKKRFYELSDWRMTAAEWEVFYFMGKFCEITGLVGGDAYDEGGKWKQTARRRAKQAQAARHIFLWNPWRKRYGEK